MHVSNSHKEQHFVAKTYLRPWAHREVSRGAWIDIYSRSGAFLGEKRTDKVMRKPELYTIYTEGLRDLKWEVWLDNLESEYATTRDRILANNLILNNVDLPVILRFAAAQRYRGYSKIRHIERNLTNLIRINRETGRNTPIALASGAEITMEDVNKWTGYVTTDVIIPEIIRMTDKMTGMNACLLTTSNREGFWTSDNPMLTGTSLPYTATLNIEGADREVRLPISPEACILLAWKPLERRYELPLWLLARFNHDMQRAATDLVVRRRVGGPPKTDTARSGRR